MPIKSCSNWTSLAPQVQKWIKDVFKWQKSPKSTSLFQYKVVEYVVEFIFQLCFAHQVDVLHSIIRQFARVSIYHSISAMSGPSYCILIHAYKSLLSTESGCFYKMKYFTISGVLPTQNFNLCCTLSIQEQGTKEQVVILVTESCHSESKDLYFYVC